VSDPPSDVLTLSAGLDEALGIISGPGGRERGLDERGYKMVWVSRIRYRVGQRYVPQP